MPVITRHGREFQIVDTLEPAPALPQFTREELALLTAQADRQGCPLPIPIEVLDAILAVKRAFPLSSVVDPPDDPEDDDRGSPGPVARPPGKRRAGGRAGSGRGGDPD